MSSLSSFSDVSSMAHFSGSGANRSPMSNTKVYLCPNCRNSYDFSLRNNMYIGRVPLILKCGHTMCEECIRNSFTKKTVTCIECKQQSILNENDIRTIQEVFPVNFYLMGVIYYSKPNISEVSKLALRPAGVSYRQKDKRISIGSNSSMSSDPSDVWSQTLVENYKEKCCQVNCKKTAVFRCSDCDDYYCHLCCQTLHRAAKGLQKHKITPLTGDTTLELTEKCAFHIENVLEFYCNTCSGIICAYCVIQNHQGHNFYQLTFLNESDRKSFGQLIENAQEKLKKLVMAHKKIKHIYQEVKNSQTSSTEINISNYFSQLHGRIQLMERKLRNEAKNSGGSTSKLIELGNETLCNVKNLHKIVGIARSITDLQSTNNKYNVKVIIERLENALDLPCYLVGNHKDAEKMRFVCNKIFDNLEECFSLSLDDNSSRGFRLVKENDLPEDYETDNNSIEISPLDISNLTLTPDDVSETLFPFHGAIGLSDCEKAAIEALQPKAVETQKNTVESWIQSVAGDDLTSEMPKLKQDNREYVTVTHIDSPECFYVQLCRFSDRLQHLNKEIGRYVLNFAPIVKDVEINQLYIVKYETTKGDRHWCRGRAIEQLNNTDGETSYKVLFIDYGNTGIVKPDMMRIITAALAKPTPLALQCKLFNIYPSGKRWDSNALMLMIQILTGVDTLMIVINNCGGHLEVDLIIVNSGNVCSIREALIFIGHGVPALGASAPIDYLKMKTTQPLARLHNRTENFKADQAIEIVLSHVVDPDKIYVQMADYIHHIDNLNTVMNQHYNKPVRTTHHRNIKGENIYVPKKDMIIAVRCPIIGNLWYRGIVKNVQKGQGMVEVFVADYGSTVVVSYTDIRKLSERFRNLDCQALLMRMSDIRPKSGHKTWSDSAIEFLNKYVEKKEKLKAVVTQADKPPKVLLFECYASMDICINTAMVKENLAISTGKSSTVLEWLKASSEDNKKEPNFVYDLLNTIQCSKIEEDEEELDLKTIVKLRRNVQVLLTKSPDEIFVALEDEKTKSQQQELYYNLQGRYNTKRERIPNPKIGDRCVVFCKKKNGYFRAVITEKVDDINFAVMLRDIAEKIIVSKGNIYILDDDFKEYTEGAVRCHLTGIVPAGDSKKWSGLAIEYLQGVFNEQSNILMSKDGPVDKVRKSFPVVMWYTEIKGGKALEPSRQVCLNINKLLIEKGLALKDGKPQTELDTSGTSSDTMNELKVIETKTDRTRRNISTDCIKVQSTSTSSDSSDNPVHLLFKTPSIHHLRKTSCRNSPNQDIQSDISSESDSSSSKQTSSDKLVCFPTSPSEQLNRDTSTPIHSAPTPNTLSESDIEVVKEYDMPNSFEKQEKESIMQSTSETTDWLPPQPFTSHKFSATATFIDDSGYIYLHESKLDEVLKAMEEKMKLVFDNIPPEPPGSLWIPGQLCTTKYFVNNSWYRGKVTEVKEDTIKVLMIDYGNEEECNHEDLRYKVMYMNFPAFANRIKLHNVFPKKNAWITSDLDELHRKIVEQTIQVFLKGKIRENVVPPAVVMLDDININRYMLKFSPNLTKNVHDISDSAEDDVIIEEISDPMESPSPVIIKQYALSHATYYHKPLSEDLIDQKIPVTIVNIIHFNQFIFELNLDDELLKTKEDFELLSEDIRKDAERQPQVNELHVGLACVAKFSEDNEWYRGEIADYTENANSANVWFVDFGNFETVEKICIRAVKPEWLMFPVQQYIGLVNNIKLTEESHLEKVVENVVQYCGSAKIAHISTVEPFHLELYNEDGILAYQDLIDEGLLVKF